MEIAIVAGEVSGDFQAGRLVKEIKKIMPDIKIWGIGGPEMQEAGLELVSDITELAVVGFWEVLKNYRRIRKVFYNILNEIKKRRPGAVVLVDYPGFNLRLAGRVKPMGIPVIYYISPQVWAWGKSRIRKIKELVDKMIVIFPFEKELYEKEGIPAEFVGHPIIDILAERVLKRDALRKEFKVIGSERLIGILPGSRIQEVKRHLPVFLKAAKKIKNAKFLIGAASSKIYELLNPAPACKGGVKDGQIPILLGRTYDIMDASDLILTSSGTATLETACFGTPMVVIYKMNWLTYLFIRQMITIPYIAMVNVISGKKVVPEFIQFAANAKNVVKSAIGILEDPSEIRQELAKVRQKLGGPGVVRRAAEKVCEVISG